MVREKVKKSTKKKQQPKSRKQPKATTEVVDINTLKPHPRNYRDHHDDQIDHIVESITEHGIYRNVVIARDSTILAGHGVVKAAGKMKMKKLPIIRLDLDPNDPQALKVLTGDNEISKLAMVDDRALTEMLKEISEQDITGLLGTGFNEQVLANLLMVTRPASEIADFNSAAEWVGMPEYENAFAPLKIVVSFRNAEDRTKFMELTGQKAFSDKTKSAWYPYRAQEDLSSVKVEG